MQAHLQSRILQLLLTEPFPKDLTINVELVFQIRKNGGNERLLMVLLKAESTFSDRLNYQLIFFFFPYKVIHN
jgi:hypothetical protein